MNYARRAVLAGSIVLLTLASIWLAGQASALRYAIASRDEGGPIHPSAIVENSAQDFGKIAAGNPLEARFVVGNAGTRRLVLRALNGGCDCLRMDVPEVFVQPGEKRTLSARVDTKELQGPLKLEFGYRTNDPQRPRLRFVVLVDIEPSAGDQ